MRVQRYCGRLFFSSRISWFRYQARFRWTCSCLLRRWWTSVLLQYSFEQHRGPGGSAIELSLRYSHLCEIIVFSYRLWKVSLRYKIQSDAARHTSFLLTPVFTGLSGARDYSLSAPVPVSTFWTHNAGFQKCYLNVREIAFNRTVPCPEAVHSIWEPIFLLNLTKNYS